MTGTHETQTPKARLLCGPVLWSVRCVLCCATAVRWFAVCGLCAVDVCRVPILARKRLPILYKYVNVTSNK